MNRLSTAIAACFLAVAVAAPAQEEGPRTFHWKKKESGHLIEILMVEIPFVASLHKIVRGEGPTVKSVDGREPWGSDYEMPGTELATFTVKWILSKDGRHARWITAF